MPKKVDSPWSAQLTPVRPEVSWWLKQFSFNVNGERMSAKRLVVAVAGATGMVGNEMISVLVERKFPFAEIKLLASENSRGTYLDVGEEEVAVDVLDENSFEGVDIALFAIGANESAKFAPIAAKAGAWVIDNSSHFRMHDGIPLVVPEVNLNTITADTKIIANPNCSTIQLVPVLKVLNELAGLKRVVVSTYQAVSGAGKKAVDELFEQARAVFTQKEIEIEAFQHQIAFNCIPQVDVFLENGYTKEEFKIINESRKILGIPDLKITSTAVRVPVFNSHAESVNVELKNPLSPQAFKDALRGSPGITLCESDSEYPMQIDTAGKDDIYVGRIRQDVSAANALDFWVVADNIRKGAALNAVQIAEELLKRHYS